MIFAGIVIAYVLAVLVLIRLAKSLHGWDEEMSGMWRHR